MANILVVDDEKGIRDILEQLLSTAGYDVCTANEGEEAVEKVDTYSPDLVILDIKMPGMDGYEVCQKIRESNSDSELPILMVSGNNDPEDELKAIKVGANEFISKPFNSTLLLAWVKILLNKE